MDLSITEKINIFSIFLSNSLKEKLFLIYSKIILIKLKNSSFCKFTSLNIFIFEF